MDYKNSSKIKFKNSIKDLFNKDTKYRPKTRAELMKKIKNIILSNHNLNNHEISTNYLNEYHEMNLTMKKFNQTQNIKKNIVTELSKENTFFSKSYSNMISSMIMNLENKNINYQTISNFNKNYIDKFSKFNEKNFFYQNPLLLTKKKDMKNFYLYQKECGEENDQYLNYSKKILNGINKQLPMMKISNIIQEMSNNKNNRTFHRMKTFKKPEKEIIISNSFERRKSVTQRIKEPLINFINTNVNNNLDNNKNKNNGALKLNKNFFEEKNTVVKEIPRVGEIKILKKISKDNKEKKISKEKNIKNKNKIKKNSKEKKLSLFPETKTNIKNKKSRNNENKKDLEFIPLTERNIKRTSNIKLFDKLIKLGISKKEINNIKERMLDKKIKRISRLKGSIQIKNIYDDCIKTKRIIDDYKKANSTKLKYLYYSSGKKELRPLDKNEKENTRINKLEYNLFWNINKG